MTQQWVSPIQEIGRISEGCERRGRLEANLTKPKGIGWTVGTLDGPRHHEHGLGSEQVEIAGIKFFEILIEMQHRRVVAQIG